jgi:hypothetical protein
MSVLLVSEVSTRRDYWRNTAVTPTSLPCPLKVSQSFLRIVQILVAEKLGKEFLSGQPKGSKIGQGKIRRHGNIHKSSL